MRSASPKRIELLDLLGQGEKTVEALAEQVATPIKNTSAHLRVLRQARLVETRRDGTYIYYRLADEDVFRLAACPRSARPQPPRRCATGGAGHISTGATSSSR